MGWAQQLPRTFPEFGHAHTHLRHEVADDACTSLQLHLWRAARPLPPPGPQPLLLGGHRPGLVWGNDGMSTQSTSRSHVQGLPWGAQLQIQDLTAWAASDWSLEARWHVQHDSSAAQCTCCCQEAFDLPVQQVPHSTPLLLGAWKALSHRQAWPTGPKRWLCVESRAGSSHAAVLLLAGGLSSFSAGLSASLAACQTQAANLALITGA